MLVCVDDGGTNKFPDSVVLVGQVRPWGACDSELAAAG